MGVTLAKGITGVPGPEVELNGSSVVDGAATLNFTGDVTVTKSGDTAIIDITGGAGTITEIDSGTGINITAGTGPVVTVALANTAITPSTYGDTTHVGTFQVDQQGRLVAAANAAISASGIGAAPSNAQYVALATSAGLSDERVLTAGALIDLTDGGAGSTITVDVDLTELSINSGEGQASDYLAIVTAAGGQVRTLISDVIANAGIAPSDPQYVVLATSTGLSNERVLTAGALIDLADAGAGSTITVDVDLTELAINAAEGQTSDYLAIVTAAGGQVRTLISDVITNAGIVPTSRALTAGNGLSGGGDLSANRTFDLDLNELTTDATGGAPTDYLPFVDVSGSNSSDKVLVSDFVTNAGIVSTSRTLTPNAPLSGGGDLSADRTISLDAAAGSTLLGRRSESAGAYEAITLGTGLSMSSTTLNASAAAAVDPSVFIGRLQAMP